MALAVAPVPLALPGFQIATTYADQTDARLDGRFTVLRRTDSPREPAFAEARIWEFWQESRNDAAEELLREARQAMRHGDYGAALELCGKSIAQAPNFAAAWNRRATIRYILRDLEGSLDDIARVLDLEPRHFGTLSGRGLVLMATDRDREAVDAFEVALAVHPHLDGARQQSGAARETGRARDLERIERFLNPGGRIGCFAIQAEGW